MARTDDAPDAVGDDRDDAPERRRKLSLEELETLAELYGASGNASQVAETMGVAPSTVTRALARLGTQNRAKLQRGVLTAGLIRGAKRLNDTAERLWEVLQGERAAGQGIDAKDIAALGNAHIKAEATLAKLDEHEERRLQARLTRKKTRAETAAIRRKADEVPALHVLLAKLSPEQVLALLRGLTTEQIRALLAETAPAPAEAPPEGT